MTAVNNKGNTPLYFAATGHAEVVAKLLEKGAEVTAVNNKGNTPLQYAIDQVKTANAEVIMNAQLRRLDFPGEFKKADGDGTQIQYTNAEETKNNI